MVKLTTPAGERKRLEVVSPEEAMKVVSGTFVYEQSPFPARFPRGYLPHKISVPLCRGTGSGHYTLFDLEIDEATSCVIVVSCNPLQDEIQNDEREKNYFDLANILCARLVPWLRVGNIFHRVYDVVERQTNNFSCGVFCAANLFFDCLVDPSLRYSLAWIL